MLGAKNNTTVIPRGWQIFSAVHSVTHAANYAGHLNDAPEIRYGKPPPQLLVVKKKGTK